MNAILFKFTMPKQPRFQSKEPSINLVSKHIYHRIDGVLLASSKYGKRQLVIKNKPADWNQSETARYFDRKIIRIRRILSKLALLYFQVFVCAFLSSNNFV